HTLLAGFIAAAYLAPLLPRLVGWNRENETTTSGARRLSALYAGLVVLLSLRALEDDPQGPWWSIAALLLIALLAAAGAWATLRRSLVWMSAMLLNLAVTIWWIDSGHRLVVDDAELPGWFYVNVVA